MLEPGGDFDLAGEALGPQRRGQLGPQHLHRDVAMVLEVLGEIDRGHAALAQLPLDAVAVGEGGGESRVDGQWSMVSDCRLLIADCRLVRAVAEPPSRLIIATSHSSASPSVPSLPSPAAAARGRRPSIAATKRP